MIKSKPLEQVQISLHLSEIEAIVQALQGACISMGVGPHFEGQSLRYPKIKNLLDRFSVLQNMYNVRQNDNKEE
jgi:hypothetical protein